MFNTSFNSIELIHGVGLETKMNCLHAATPEMYLQNPKQLQECTMSMHLRQ